MSDLNETHSQPTASSPDEVPPASELMDVTAAVGQLRVLVCGLGAALLIVSLALSVFVFKQNRNLNATNASRQRQIAQLQKNGQVLDYVVNELARYSAGKPELTALFAKHGVDVTPPSALGQPASAPKH
jgi:uncharacterized protein HemX